MTANMLKKRNIRKLIPPVGSRHHHLRSSLAKIKHTNKKLEFDQLSRSIKIKENSKQGNKGNVIVKMQLSTLGKNLPGNSQNNPVLSNLITRGKIVEKSYRVKET